MKNSILQKRRVLRTVLFILLLSVVGMTKMYAYSFSAVCETGQTLYYFITDANNHYVKLTCPGSSTSVNCWEGYTKPTGNIILPETVQYGGVTYTVTSIGNRAFMECSGMTGNLTIPNTVTSIGREAFRQCRGFNGSLTISNSVTTIDYCAFEYCSNFTGNLTIGNSVTTIGNDAFRYCNHFTSVTLPNSIATIEYGAFYGCSGLTAVYYTGDIAQWCNISFGYSGNPLEEAHNLYIDNVLVTDLVISETLTEIKENTFSGATCLTSLTLSNSVTTISAGAFNNCTGLTGGLTLPNSVTSIAYGAFYGCYGLTGVYYMGDIAQWCNITFGEYGSNPLEYAHNLYIDNTLVTDLVIPDNVTEIKAYTFNKATCLTSLTLSNAVTTIGEGAFANCTGLTGGLTLPTSVTTIGYWAFYNCTGLTGVYYTGDITQWCNIFFGDLPDGAAYYIEEDEEYPTPSSNPLEYAHNLYIDNTLVTDLVIPDNVTEIQQYSFSKATCLTSLTLPNTLTSIGNGAFEYCTGLTGNLTLPNSLTTIGYAAFKYCTGLTGILTIPDSVTSIGGEAFKHCSGFTGSLIIPNSVTTIDYATFKWCTGLTGSLIIPDSVTTIYSEAFKYCSGLTGSLIIPNSVTTIYYAAFKSCTGLTSIIVAANTPPTLSNSVFYGVPTTIPVYVPCDALEAYQNANGWSNFTNIIEICDLEIVASANPSEGGTVEGDGSYGLGQTCTLTASANDDYMFVNWTENGEEVSTNSTYSFTVMGERTLVANFNEIVNHWEPESNPYEDNMTLTCVVQIDGVEQTSTMLELGAFCGTECRGSQRATYFAPTDRYIFQMTVFGESSDVISFRLYDHQLGEELVLTPPAPLTFNSNGYGSLSNPYVLNFTSAITHTQAFNSGWNWWSTYIELTDNDGLNQLENSIGEAGIMIKSRTNGYVEAYEYNGTTSWYGTLSSINNEQMYKIRTNAACNATVEGLLAVPANHPISINSGWNWIGFPCNQDMSVDVAMSGFTPENEDIIKGRNGFTTYYSDGNYNMWYGTLNTFEPGKGYMYRSNSTTQKTLVFQTGRGETVIENITSENNHFQPFGDDFADNMSIMAVLELDGEELRSEDYELAAFVGDECRGSVRLMYVEPVDRYVVFLTVFGEPSETLYFRLTDGTQTELSMDEVAFVADGMAGTLAEPMTLRFGTTQVDENGLSKVMVYPNPSKDVFHVQGQGIRKIEVFNAFGQAVVSEETKNDDVQIDLSRYADGCYLLRVVTDNGITNTQLIKR